ncbi:MAG TPA: hypothetical protein P5563_10105, partial [Saprospiraceae bacterium]|nr:hypothetical protein [Saprospiraceae bacterium]
MNIVIPHIPTWVIKHPFWIFLILILPICACISITMAPRRMDDDGGSAPYNSDNKLRGLLITS